MIDVIDRNKLQDQFEAECIEECACCLHNCTALDGTKYCGLINDAPRANVVSKAAYDDLYSKYLKLAELFNELLSRIIKMIKDVTPPNDDNGGA